MPFWRPRSDKPHLWRPYCFRCDRPPLKGAQPSLIVDGQKCCKDCRNWFPATPDHFGSNRSHGKEYLRSYCKGCQTKRHAGFVEKNPEKVRSYAKKSYDKHSRLRIDREIERDRRLRSDPVLGPLRRAQYNALAAKRREDPSYVEKMREWGRNYAKTPLGSARYNRRRARHAGAPGEYTRADVLTIAEAQSFRCYWCKADIKDRISADHYIPLSKGGTNYPSNIVAACPSCNSTKHNKLPDEFLEHIRLKDAIKSRR